MNVLKPCPWCGRTPDIDQIDNRRYFVQCRTGSCPIGPCTYTYNSEEEAIEAWNNREEE